MSSNVLPQDMAREARLARTWTTVSALSSLVLWFLSLLILPYMVWASRQHLSLPVLDQLIPYLGSVVADPLGPLRVMLFSPESPVTWTGALGGCVALLALWFVVGVVATKLCPFRAALMIHGDARWANRRDLDVMNARRQVGPAGTYLHLGYGPGNQRMALIETLSLLCMAPPGTGKTTRVIVPGILVTDDASLLVHDPKPELWDLCSGYRSTLGPTFRLDWSKMNDINEDAPDASVWHPSFNFLDPAILPGDEAARDTFLDALVKVLIPEGKGGGGSSDYFIPKGQSALMGFLHFLIATVNDRMDDPGADPWSECFLPEMWRGKAASFPMVVDFIAASQKAFAPQQPPDQPPHPDPQKPWLEALVDTATQRGYPQRCIRELSPLINTAPQERSGILGTMDKGLAPFKIASASQRTAISDFTPADMRGRLTADALEELGLSRYPASRAEWDAIASRLRNDHWAPITVFVCVNQAEAAAFASLTSLFFECVSKVLLSYGPGERTSTGVLMGPYAVGFMLDELAKMAKCDAVLAGPDLGRSKRVFYLLVAQDIHQIELIYTKEQRAIIFSTTAVKFILPVTSPETIKSIADMVGKVTIKRSSTSRAVGFNQKIFDGNRSETTEGVSLLNTSNLGSMPMDEHVLIIQGFQSRPVRCKSAMSYKDPVCVERCYNPRDGSGPQPAPPLPLVYSEPRIEGIRVLAAERARVRAAVLAEHRFTEERYRWDPQRMAQTPALAP